MFNKLIVLPLHNVYKSNHYAVYTLSLYETMCWLYLNKSERKIKAWEKNTNQNIKTITKETENFKIQDLGKLMTQNVNKLILYLSS